jgi:hypothetical protein
MKPGGDSLEQHRSNGHQHHQCKALQGGKLAACEYAQGNQRPLSYHRMQAVWALIHTDGRATTQN